MIFQIILPTKGHLTMGTGKVFFPGMRTLMGAQTVRVGEGLETLRTDERIFSTVKFLVNF
jgi:hypothetical protein